MDGLSADELNRFLKAEFMQLDDQFIVEEASPKGVAVRLRIDERHLRPGGTVSGPSMFGLADLAAYCAVMAQIGEVAQSVTVSANIDFLRRPAAEVDLIAKARVLKLGATLAVCDILISAKGDDRPVARAAMTYAMPPGRGKTAK